MLLINKTDFKAFCYYSWKVYLESDRVTIIGCLIGNLREQNIIHCPTFNVSSAYCLYFNTEENSDLNIPCIRFPLDFLPLTITESV